MVRGASVSHVRAGIARELHAPARKRYRRRRVLTRGLDDLWQADLVDMLAYARFNRNKRYILTVIDVYSKFAWAEPVARKTGELVTQAFARVLSRSGRCPALLHTDDGKEFFNASFTRLMKNRGIRHYSTYSAMKAAVVERFNRTLKGRMWQRFSAQGSYKWLDMLPGLLADYNSRIHRSIGVAPKTVTNDDLMHSVYAAVKRSDPRWRRLRVGDRVRVSKHKTVFAKGYTPSWSTEIFTVDRVHLSNPVTYTLTDASGQLVAGRFYLEELQRTRFPQDYLVERVLRKKGPLRFVKWLGFDARHNSWIPAKDMYT